MSAATEYVTILPDNLLIFQIVGDSCCVHMANALCYVLV